MTLPHLIVTQLLLYAFLAEMSSAWFITLYHFFLEYCSRMNRVINLHYEDLAFRP